MYAKTNCVHGTVLGIISALALCMLGNFACFLSPDVFFEN